MADSDINMKANIETDEAIRKAKNLSNQIKSALAQVDFTKIDVGTLKIIHGLERMVKELDNVVKSTEELGNMKMPTQEFRRLEIESKSLDQQVSVTLRKLEMLRADGFEGSSLYTKEEAKLARFQERQQAVSEEMRKMRDAGADYNTGKDTQAYKSAAATINTISQSITTLCQNIAQLNQAYQQEEAEAQRVAEGMEAMKNVREEDSRTIGSYASSLNNRLTPVIRRLGGLVQRLWHGFRSLASHMRTANRHTGSFNNSLKSTLKNILRYTIGVSSILALINRVRSTVKEAFKVMAQEIPEVNQAISMLGTSFKQLKAATGTMLQPLLQAVAPLVNQIIQKVVSLMNALGRFFATLTGQDYVYEATVANYDYAESVKEAEGALASFDKLNVISKQKNDLALDKNTVKYTKVKIEPEDNWYTRLAKKIRDGWAKADLSGAGFDIATKLAELLDSISWDDINAKSTRFITTLTSGINGLTMPDDTGESPLARSIGNFIGNAINWAINNLHAFATTINWGQLGDFIADAIDTLKKNLDTNETWTRAGEAFGELFQGLIELGIKVFINNNPFEGLGASLSNLLDAFFTKGFEKNKTTGHTYFYELGHILVKGFTDLLTEVEVLIDREGPALVEAVNEIALGINENGLGKLFLTLGRVILKGIFLGIKLALSAGLGLLGISVDDELATFIAEAVGIGLLATKIGGLVSAITGGSGTGGLLGAFKKKDTGLQNQTKKTALDTVATLALSGAIGVAAASALGMSTDLGTLTEGTKVTADMADKLTERMQNLSTVGTTACEDLATKSEEASGRIQVAFNGLSLSIPDIDVSKLNAFEKTALEILARIQKAYSEFNPNIKTTGDGVTQVHSGAADDAAHFGEKYQVWLASSKGSETATDANTKALDRQYEQQQASIKATQALTDVTSDALDRQYDQQQANIKATQELTDSVVDLEEYFGDYYMKRLFELNKGMTVGALDNQNLLMPWSNEILQEYANWKDEVLKEYSTLSPSEAKQVVQGLKGILDNYYNPSSSSGSSDHLIDSALKGLENFVKWLPTALGAIFGAPVPSLPLAKGAVLPPNQPFLAMVGDQTSGTNVEAPLATIEQAVANVLTRMGIKVDCYFKTDSKTLFKMVKQEATVYEMQHHGSSAL